jgi:hypothetical protein
VQAGVNEALRTWDCKTPGCEETAYKHSGPYAMLCRLCTEEAKREKRRNGSAAAPLVVASPAPSGSFEFRAHGLLKLGRQVDEAFAAYRPAREALEEAWRRWQEAIAQLPAAPNGELDGAAANRLLTNGLAQAVTDDDPGAA